MKWIGLILMIIAAVVYWLSKINHLDPLLTNISILSIALGAVIMAVAIIISKRVK